jgi:chromosome segregation ATPase
MDHEDALLYKHQIDLDKAHEKIRGHDVDISALKSECERNKKRISVTEDRIDEIRNIIPTLNGTIASVKADTNILHRDLDKLTRANTQLAEAFNDHTVSDNRREREHIEVERGHTESVERLNRNLSKIAVGAVVFMVTVSILLQRVFDSGWLSGLL